MQLLEWAAYYVSESQFSEEEAQNWVDACLAQPDPPGFVPAPQEEATLQAENAQQVIFAYRPAIFEARQGEIRQNVYTLGDRTTKKDATGQKRRLQ